MILLDMVNVLGKGPGFVAFAFVQLAIVAWLLKAGVSGAEIGMALAPINTALYGAGAWKASVEAKNGNGKHPPVS